MILSMVFSAGSVFWWGITPSTLKQVEPCRVTRWAEPCSYRFRQTPEIQYFKLPVFGYTRYQIFTPDWSPR